MKQLQGFVRRAAALVLAAALCLCAPAALAADDAAVSGGAVTMGGANTTLIPAEEENCLSWLFGSGDTITLPYLNIRGQGLKKNVTLNLVDCLVGITYNELGSIGSYVSASAAQQAWKAQAVAAHSYLEYHKQYGSSANALVYTPVDQIPSAAREAIRKAVERMGFAEMTEIQEKTIPVMLAGHDVIAKAPTGTGKTCAFGIPVAEHIQPENKYPQAVIMAPTRELAQQIAEELSNLTYFMPEVQVACVYGGANMEKQAKRLAEGCQIVVATPGRLMDHYKHHSIDISHVTQIVLDEADEMLNMGFYKDVRHIIEMMKARKALSMFSATISREVMDIGWLYQHNAEEITVQPQEESQPKITQYMLETSGRNKLSDLAQIIIGEGYKRVMVFCDTKFNTATLANQLARLGFSVDCLHGDLSQKERNQIMQNFRDGKLAILVATDVAARGIDVSDVDAVVNYDVPSDNEHYTHRIGRTGRAKKEGVSYLFYVPEEKKRVQELLRLTRNTDLCTPVHFDFNHEHIVVEEKKDSADRFQIKCYF